MREANKGQATRGFSLIELLVVVVILGVIIVASIPGILRYLPRYRLDRVAENLCQAARTARSGAVTAHCNNVLRFWADFDRTIAAGAQAVAYDVWMDRNNNMTFDSQASVPDKIITFKTFYKDVFINMNPAVSGRAPYTTFNQVAQQLVFRPDGRVYKYAFGVYTPITSKDGAVAVESLSLPTPVSTEKALYKYRFVEIDPLGSVRLYAKSSQGN